MPQSSDETIRKIFGKSIKDVLTTEPDSFKSFAWKKLKTDDGSTGLFGTMRVSSLEEATTKARSFAVKLSEYSKNTNEASHISCSSDGLAIILYGSSKNEFTDKDWKMAHELDAVLSSDQ